MIRLKHIFFLFIAAIFIFSSVSFAAAQEAAAEAEAEEEAALQFPVSFSYSSVYWWRGYVLSEEAGFFWPGVSAVLWNSGVELNITAGICENWFTEETSESEDWAKSYTEVDYTVSYSKEIDKLSLGFGLMYFQYPFYDEADPELIDPSYFEGSVTCGYDTILSPSLELYYDYFPEDSIGSDGKKVPTTEDYYIKLAVSHDIVSTEDGFALTAGAWIGYYNNAYYEASGLSDAVISLGLSKDYNNLSAFSDLYYGRTIGKDFRDANGEAGVTVKDHFWCDFGLTYTL